MTTLILYSTTDGHTLSICNYLADQLRQLGETITITKIDDCLLSPEKFDKVIIGASIRYGHHQRAVYNYIKKFSIELNNTKGVFFSVSLVARKPERAEVKTNPYLQKFLNDISWQPAKVSLFAGKLNYPVYSFWDKWIIRFIMWLTKGPTDLQSVVDFTNWRDIELLANEIAKWEED